MAEFLKKKMRVVEPGEAIELELNKNNGYVCGSISNDRGTVN